MRAPKRIEVGLDLKIFKVTGFWEPNDSERAAAWELYVELMTRVVMVPLPDQGGVLREALSSLHSLFGITRVILRQHGPSVAEPKPDGHVNFGHLSLLILNDVVRPPLTRWHPLLEEWEAVRPPGRSRVEHEQEWPKAAELRKELDTVRINLNQYAALLSSACGVPDLSVMPMSGGRIGEAK